MANNSLFNVNAVIQILATIIGVVMGFFLSKLTENREWKRRKIEMLMDKQLSSVLSLQVILNEIIDSCNQATGDLTILIQGIDCSGMSPAIRDAAKADLNFFCSKLLSQVDGWREKVMLHVIELRLLGFRVPGQKHIEAYPEMLKKIRNIVSAIQLEPTTDRYKDFDSAVQELKKETDNLIKTAVSSLYE